MVFLEVLESPDQNMLGEHKLFFPFFSIGNNKRCEIWFEDDSMKGKDLSLKCIEQGLYIHNVDATSFYKNGKKVVGHRLFKEGDKIKIGETTLLIKKYDWETILKSDENLLSVFENTNHLSDEAKELMSKLKEAHG